VYILLYVYVFYYQYFILTFIGALFGLPAIRVGRLTWDEHVNTPISVQLHTTHNTAHPNTLTETVIF